MQGLILPQCLTCASTAWKAPLEVYWTFINSGSVETEKSGTLNTEHIPSLTAEVTIRSGQWWGCVKIVVGAYLMLFWIVFFLKENKPIKVLKAALYPSLKLLEWS